MCPYFVRDFAKTSICSEFDDNGTQSRREFLAKNGHCLNEGELCHPECVRTHKLASCVCVES